MVEKSKWRRGLSKGFCLWLATDQKHSEDLELENKRAFKLKSRVKGTTFDAEVDIKLQKSLAVLYGREEERFIIYKGEVLQVQEDRIDIWLSAIC